MSKYKAALFDFDGVIATSPEDNFRAWQFAFEPYDCSLDRDAYFLLEGIPGKKQVYHFLEQVGLEESLAPELLERKRQHYSEHADPEPYPGILEAIEAVHSNDLQIGLVSGGNRERIESFLEQHKLNQFKCLLSGDSVTNSKPSPDPYLEGAKQLGVSPAECIVIENAPLGIQAAKAAGMYCVALAHTLEPEKLTEADHVLESAADLAEFLSTL